MSVHEFSTPLRFCPGFQEMRDEYQNTAGLLIAFGTSTNRVKTALADTRFLDFNLENSATSGDNRGMYLRLYLSGAGGGGEALRVFTTVENVAAGTAHGAHISINFGTSGTVTGQAIALRSTIHMPETALPASNHTYAALQAEIYSDAATSDPSGNLLSAIRVVNGGNATGGADVDDDCFLFDFVGWTQGAGNLIGALGNEPTWTTNKTFTVKVRLPDGTTGYLVGVVA